jgi:hypothetical protein
VPEGDLRAFTCSQSDWRFICGKRCHEIVNCSRGSASGSPSTPQLLLPHATTTSTWHLASKYIYISKHGWKMLTICQLRYDFPLQPSGGRSRSSQRCSRPLAPLAWSEEETTPRSKVGGGGIKQRGAFAISTLCGKVTCFKFQSCPRPQRPPCTVLNIPHRGAKSRVSRTTVETPST